MWSNLSGIVNERRPGLLLRLFLAGAAAGLCVVCFGWNVRGLLNFVFLTLLIQVACEDAKHRKISDQVVFSILIVGVLAAAILPDVSIGQRLGGMAAGGLPLFAVTFLFPGAFGGGDIKLMTVCGFFLGWKLTLLALLTAVVSGGLWGACLLASGRAGYRDRLAFGPFLCLGMAGALIGSSIIPGFC